MNLGNKPKLSSPKATMLGLQLTKPEKFATMTKEQEEEQLRGPPVDSLSNTSNRLVAPDGPFQDVSNLHFMTPVHQRQRTTPPSEARNLLCFRSWSFPVPPPPQNVRYLDIEEQTQAENDADSVMMIDIGKHDNIYLPSMESQDKDPRDSTLLSAAQQHSAAGGVHNPGGTMTTEQMFADLAAHQATSPSQAAAVDSLTQHGSPSSSTTTTNVTTTTTTTATTTTRTAVSEGNSTVPPNLDVDIAQLQQALLDRAKADAKALERKGTKAAYDPFAQEYLEYLNDECGGALPEIDNAKNFLLYTAYRPSRQGKGKSRKQLLNPGNKYFSSKEYRHVLSRAHEDNPDHPIMGKAPVEKARAAILKVSKEMVPLASWMAIQADPFMKGLGSTTNKRKHRQRKRNAMEKDTNILHSLEIRPAISKMEQHMWDDCANKCGTDLSAHLRHRHNFLSLLQTGSRNHTR